MLEFIKNSDYQNLLYVGSFIILFFLNFFISKRIRNNIQENINKKKIFDEIKVKKLSLYLVTIIFLTILQITFYVYELLDIKVIKQFTELEKILGLHIIKSDSINITIYLIFQVVLIWYIAHELSYWVKHLTLSKLKKNSYLQKGTTDSVTKIISYISFLFWLFIGFNMVGIDLSVFWAGSAVLGIGIGFGLQNLTSNFVSGIVILFERPIKKGDLIEVDSILGTVETISFRSTVINTQDNITIIMPNSKIITENVTNWSHQDRKIRLRISVGVSYNSDLELVRKVLIESAEKNSTLLKRPSPQVILTEFADSSVNLSLLVWTQYPEQKLQITSDLNFNIFKRFKEEGIQIPFPQMDLHVQK
jgi:small-conductance mechanosensitive channel